MSDDGSAQQDQLTLPPPPEPRPAPLSRAESGAPTACHVEDVTQPCTNPHCGVHTSTNTPAVSRAVSHVNLTALAEQPYNSYGHGDGGSTGGVPDAESELHPQIAAEQVLQEGVLRENTPPVVTVAPPPQEDHIQEPPSPLTSPPPTTDQVETAPAAITALAQQDSLSDERPPQITPGTTPSPPPEEQQPEQEKEEATLNWNFDDPESLQEHVSGGPDPFAQLHKQAPDRSASFPSVPTPANAEPDEESLMAMMASEVATETRGLFDSPAVEQDGFFGTEAVADDGDDFFAKVDQQDTSLTLPMGTSNMDAFGLQRQDTTQQRYEEGLPLVQDAELIVDSKKEIDFFGSEPDSPSCEDTIFAGIDQVATEPIFGGGLQRKSTEQFMAGQLYHFGGDEAAGMSTGVSQPLPGVAEEEVTVVEEQAMAPVEARTVVAEEQAATLVAEEQVVALEEHAAVTEEQQQIVGQQISPGALFTQPTQADGDDFFSQLGQDQEPAESHTEEPPKDEVAAKWQAALADDEFLDDEDEGFLPSDDEEVLPNDQPMVSPQSPVGQAPTAARYMPVPQQQPPPQWPGQQPVSNSYTPQPNAYLAGTAPTLRHTQSAYFAPPASTPYGAVRFQAQPEIKPQSFVNKNEGYQSPYDLPMDIAPTLKRKQSNLTHVHNAMGLAGPPVRSSSVGAMLQSPVSGSAPPLGHSIPKIVAPQKQQFFEELPMAPPKARAASAQGRHAPNIGGPHVAPPPMVRAGSYNPQQPPVTGPYNPPQQIPFPRGPQHSPQTSLQPSQYAPAPPHIPRQTSTGGTAYAPPPAPAATTNRYSPAVPQGQVYAPPSLSPALSMMPGGGYTPTHAPANAPSGEYTPAPTANPPYPVAQAQPMAPPVGASKYAPRSSGPPQPTRSAYASPPVAHPQGSYTPSSVSQPISPPPVPTSVKHSPEAQPRRPTAEHHALHSSRPGTATGSPPLMETPKEEEEDSIIQGTSNVPMHPVQNRFAPPPPRSTSTPPPRGVVSPPMSVVSPPMSAAHKQFSPQKHSRPASPESFQPPPRAQTSSPGLHYGRPRVAQKARDPYERPSSALAHSMVPEDYASQGNQSKQQPFYPRKESMQVNFIPPNDYTAEDPLSRWQGAPVFTWGLGGTVTTMFPIRTTRFASGLHSAAIKCSPGAVNVRLLKDLISLPETIDSFPGPVWTGTKSMNKAKKKEVITYMDSRIEGFERTQMDIYDPTERRAADEKCMLWKIVRIMIEHDGHIEGTPEIDAAVRGVLTPDIAQSIEGGENIGFVPMTGIPTMRPANAETVDPEALKEFRKKLLTGDREGAVWFAADKRLWAHALLISGTVGKDLWKRVVEEFVKNEVKTLGEGSETLAVLYATLAGNWEESVNELVPLSARSGVPMLSSSHEQEQSLEDRLEKWKESLALILSNRSPGDQASILALGRLLASYNWTAAAHICFIFARQSPLGGGGALFGGPDDPTTDFCLLGANHRSKAELGRDLDTILLSEIYELAVSLTPHASTATPIYPHLQSWKIHHAIILAENGNKRAAEKYCDSVAAAVKAWNKPSPYFNQSFGHVLEDFTKRLQEAPRDGLSTANGTGWIPKLTSDAVSSSMWGAFNKFVSGNDEAAGVASGLQTEAEGPFGKITPSVSREQSSVDLYGMYGGGAPTAMYAPPVQGNNSPTTTRTNTAASRYAPSTATARSSMEGARPNSYEPPAVRRTSSESYRAPAMNGNPYEPNSNPYEPQAPQYGNPYEPTTPYGSVPNAYNPRASLEATPEVPEKSDTPVQNTGYAPYSPPAQDSGYQPSGNSGGYEPPANSGGYEPPASGGGYAPPSNDYTPYQPEPDSDGEKADQAHDGGKKQKKKGMMDDDDDDELLQRAEAVRKAAEKEKKKEAEEDKKGDDLNGGKKGWFGGWFGRKDPNEQSGPIKAKLGEENAFVYDAELKRWVNKKAGAAAPEAAKATPPPRRPTPATAATSTGAPTPPPSASKPPTPTSNQPPPPGPPASAPPPSSGGLAPPMGLPRGLTPSPAPSLDRPPISRPSTSGGDMMDELLGPPTARRGTPSGGRKGRKGANRYVEVIPGQQ